MAVAFIVFFAKYAWILVGYQQFTAATAEYAPPTPNYALERSVKGSSERAPQALGKILRLRRAGTAFRAARSTRTLGIHKMNWLSAVFAIVDFVFLQFSPR